VSNYTVVNDSIEDKLKESENIYKVKKDLKRLKFINDLPNILESKLNEYISKKETKDLKILEKSLIYYEKCKQFLYLHKNNVKYIINILILVFSKRYIFKN
jgi:hypothetical protein